MILATIGIIIGMIEIILFGVLLYIILRLWVKSKTGV